jgi:two-component system LytT family response regulator
MAESKRLRAIVVDDEPPGRQKIKEYLKHDQDIELVAECSNGREAVEEIRSKSPDLLFLDIQMPGIDGFGVLEELDGDHLPAVIFVTAYDQYALQAFEVHALDYLLKPFDKERFQGALQRAKSHIEQQKLGDVRHRLLALLEGMRAAKRHANRLVVKSAGRVFFLKTDEIDWIEAAGNYVRLHTGNDTHLLRETMGAIQKKLDPNQFIRIHRSTFVNMEKIKELQPWFHGEYVVILRDGTQLTMSRSYRNNLPELLGRGL